MFKLFVYLFTIKLINLAMAIIKFPFKFFAEMFAEPAQPNFCLPYFVQIDYEFVDGPYKGLVYRHILPTNRRLKYAELKPYLCKTVDGYERLMIKEKKGHLKVIMIQKCRR